MLLNLISHRSLTITLLVLSQIAFQNCERDFSNIQPIQENNTPEIELTIEKISVKEVWLNLKIKNPGYEIWVYRDTLKIFEGNVYVKDSTIYDYNLLPKHNYSYTAYKIRNNTKVDSSSRVSVTTKALWNFIGLADTFAVRLKIAEPYLYVCSGDYGLWRTDIFDPEVNWTYLGFNNYRSGASFFFGVQDILINSENKNWLLVGLRPVRWGDHSLYRSFDGGNSWLAADSGLIIGHQDSVHAPIKRLVELPNHVLAGGAGIYISHNFGESWDKVESFGSIEALEKHRLSSNIVWCGGSDDIYEPFLLYSINSGVSWNFVNTGILGTAVWSIEFDPVHDATVYVGGGGFIKTVDGGQNWTRLFSSIIREVYIDPNNRNHLWIVIFSSEIFETWDGGLTWEPIDTPFSQETYIWDIVWHENTKTLFLATTKGVYSFTP
jgi:hypothetical protein